MRVLQKCLVVGVLAAFPINISAARLTGRVVDVIQSTGIPAVEVTVNTLDGKILATTQTDAEGRYSLDGLPRGRRVEIKGLRDGWQAHPTVRRLSLTEESLTFGDLPMVSEVGNESYYRTLAKRLAAADPALQRELRAIWFALPDINATIVKEEFASLGGPSVDEQHNRYLAELQQDTIDRARYLSLEQQQEDVRAYAENRTTVVSTSSAPMTSSVRDDVLETTTSTRRRMSKD